jgi:hypothetical protein
MYGDKYNGSKGKLIFEDTEVLITDWKVTRSVKLYKTTDSGSGANHEYKEGTLKEKDGSFTGFLLEGTATLAEGAAGTIELFTDDGRKWQGEVLIGNVNEGDTIDDAKAVQYDCKFTGNGALSFIDYGKLTGVTIDTLAAGYLNGEDVTVVQSGGSLGVLTLTVAGGVITGIVIKTAGQHYKIANGVSTSGGSGSGFKINITDVEIL